MTHHMLKNCAGHYKGVNEIIVFEKDDGHYDVSPLHREKVLN